MSSPLWLGRLLWEEHGRSYFTAVRLGAGRIVMTIGDCALFKPSKDSERPYVGRIESLFEEGREKYVAVAWFVYPQETIYGNESAHGSNELFGSTLRSECLLSVITGKCHVLTAAQYSIGIFPNIKNEPVFYSYAETRLLKRIEPYRRIHKPLKLDDGYEIEKILGKMTTTGNRVKYLVSWKSLDPSFCSWVDADKFPRPPVTTNRCPLRIRREVTVPPPEPTPSTASTPIRRRTERWDINQLVSLHDPNHSSATPLRASEIEIPSWRDVQDVEPIPVPPQPPSIDEMDLDEESSSSEDTSDGYYEHLHNLQNKRLLVLIERARSEAESQKRDMQRRRDMLEERVHYDRGSSTPF